jgi:D-alanyl-D-alanine carboxypeptidase
VANLLNATAEVNATGTQIADTMMATGTQIAIDQTQIATNLNATSVANMANTGGTATQVADHINATSTSVVASATAVANLLNATAEVNAAQTATVTGNTAGTQATPADANATTVAGQATVVPTAVPQGSPSAPQTSGIVTPLVGLNVHTTPAVTAPVVTAIAQGSAVNITRRSDDGRWLEIHFDDGSAGWVLAEYVDESDAGGASKGTLGQCSGITDAPQDVVDALDAVLSDFIDPTPGEYLIDIPPAPGVVIRVESPDWVYFEAAGFANVETGEPLNCEMPFQIGSNTKMMTATVLLQLQEEGLLSLDNMLADYLPDYAERFPNGDQMTLRQLANHTAGLGDYGDPIIGAGVSDLEARERGYTPEELLEFALENTEPSFAPGTDGAWSYSNTGYILLGLIIEDVTEQALEDVFADRIFTPLGMDDTFFWNDSSLPEFGLPANYIEAPFEEEVSSWNMSQGWAAGAVISTADDMATFITALMNGELYEDEATLDMMTDAVYAEGLLANYGIGFMSRITIHSEDTWGHGGQTLGFESVVEYDVADDISIVIWTNAGNDLAVIGDIVIDQALLDAGIIDD